LYRLKKSDTPHQDKTQSPATLAGFLFVWNGPGKHFAFHKFVFIAVLCWPRAFAFSVVDFAHWTVASFITIRRERHTLPKFIFHNCTACAAKTFAIYFDKSLSLVPGPSLSSFQILDRGACAAVTFETSSAQNAKIQKSIC
jgi:hypothetical protein